jgi:hypothetical protein
MGLAAAVKIPLRSDLRGLSDFVAYYRHFHSVTTPAERVIPGNVKKLLAEELDYIVENGEVSERLKGLLQGFKANRARVVTARLTQHSKLEAMKLIEKELTEEERRELLAVLLEGQS